jgi:hypothetical protein
MPLKQIRINDYTLDELRKVSKHMGDATDDTTIRVLTERYWRCDAQIKLLQKELHEARSILAEKTGIMFLDDEKREE